MRQKDDNNEQNTRFYCNGALSLTAVVMYEKAVEKPS